MDNNPIRPPRRNFFLEAMLRQTEPEPKPKPDWWELIKNQQSAVPVPNPLAGFLKPPYVYPFKDADEAKVLAVWCKGTLIRGYDPTVMRYDCEGSIMLFSQHGICSEFGWEIDHIVPVSAKGSDLLFNLQPLQWRNNRRKGDKVTPPPRLGLGSLRRP